MKTFLVRNSFGSAFEIKLEDDGKQAHVFGVIRSKRTLAFVASVEYARKFYRARIAEGFVLVLQPDTNAPKALPAPASAPKARRTRKAKARKTEVAS